MKSVFLAAALTVAAFPAFAQSGGYGAPGQSGFDSRSPELGARGAVAGQARAMGEGTPQIAPNGSSYVPSNRGYDPAAGYRSETTGSLRSSSVPPRIAPNGSSYVPSR